MLFCLQFRHPDLKVVSYIADTHSPAVALLNVAQALAQSSKDSACTWSMSLPARLSSHDTSNRLPLEAVSELPSEQTASSVGMFCTMARWDVGARKGAARKFEADTSDFG